MIEKQQYLARLRTQMANERTLMSYFRAALALMGISLFSLRFFDDVVFIIVSIVFGALSIFLAIYGIIRYRKFKEKLLSR